jgi:hypothetical protein
MTLLQQFPFGSLSMLILVALMGLILFEVLAGFFRTICPQTVVDSYGRVARVALFAAVVVVPWCISAFILIFTVVPA